MDRGLSPLQQKLIGLASQGRADKEIANELGISAGTIHTYWKRLRMKFGARSRGEIIAAVTAEHKLQSDQTLAEHILVSDVLIKGVEDGVALFDADMRIVQANENLAGIFGYRAAELIGKNVVELLPLPLRQAGEGAFRVALAAPEGLQKQWWVPCRNRGSVHVTCHFGRAFLGGQRHLIIYAKDTTQESLLHLAGRNEWQAFAERADTLGRFFWSATPDGNLDFVNGWTEHYSATARADWMLSGCNCVITGSERLQSRMRWQRAQQHSSAYRANVHFWSEDTRAYEEHRLSMVPLYSGGRLLRWLGSAHACIRTPVA